VNKTLVGLQSRTRQISRWTTRLHIHSVKQEYMLAYVEINTDQFDFALQIILGLGGHLCKNGYLRYLLAHFRSFKT
jgi:hypothetical protein